MGKEEIVGELNSFRWSPKINTRKWLTANCQSGLAQKEGLIVGNLSQVTVLQVRGGVSGRAQSASYPPVPH